MAQTFDFDDPDVIDARGIDWSAVAPPVADEYAAETADGRRLRTEAEFDDWLLSVRTHHP